MATNSLEYGIVTSATPEIRLFDRNDDNVHMNPMPGKGFRFYRNSPETCALQIRGEKRYAHISLNVPELELLREAINNEIDYLRPPMGTKR